MNETQRESAKPRHWPRHKTVSGPQTLKHAQEAGTTSGRRQVKAVGKILNTEVEWQRPELREILHPPVPVLYHLDQPPCQLWAKLRKPRTDQEKEVCWEVSGAGERGPRRRAYPAARPQCCCSAVALGQSLLLLFVLCQHLKEPLCSLQVNTVQSVQYKSESFLYFQFRLRERWSLFLSLSFKWLIQYRSR